VSRSGAEVRPITTVPVALRVNGDEHRLDVEVADTLLDVIREVLGLTGTKKGCDRGECGACTVLVNGDRVNACLTLAVMHDGDTVTTIEGLAGPDRLHPVQQAFVEADALQCGYCTPGQIMSAVGCLAEGRARSEDDVRQGMSGNLCRCGAYAQIVTAVRQVAEATGA
jgi:xanthine dehydrogenase YagT iron-sulfur-binding subunit